ncbi:MAG: RDD family protein [Deinococcales bacterium]
MSHATADTDHAKTEGPTTARSHTPASGRRAWVATDGTQVPKKADRTRRFLALVLDGLIAGALSIIPWLGSLLAAAYMLLRDGFDVTFMDRRSIGKRLLRLRPVRDDGSPVTWRVSVRRNWPLALTSLALFLGLVPVLGFAIRPVGTAVGIILVIFEGYLVVTDETGIRLGDHLAGTRVIESDT